jgi:hypothetical protein
MKLKRFRHAYSMPVYHKLKRFINISDFYFYFFCVNIKLKLAIFVFKYVKGLRRA